MRKLLFIALATISCSSCLDLLPHRCTFNKEVVSEKYLVHEQDCTHGTTYYLSCGCGEHGEGVFVTSEPLGHLYDGGEFYTSDEVIFPVTVKADEVCVVYTCARCGDNKVQQDTKKDNVPGHRHFAHAYTCLNNGKHEGICAIYKEVFQKDCVLTVYGQESDPHCHKCDYEG